GGGVVGVGVGGPLAEVGDGDVEVEVAGVDLGDGGNEDEVVGGGGVHIAAEEVAGVLEGRFDGDAGGAADEGASGRALRGLDGRADGGEGVGAARDERERA